jgi:hypothetical protein
MPRLSSYSNFDYPDGEEQIMPWEFWTDEERSLVIREAYKDLTLTSKEVKPYLDASRVHFYTQWLAPLAFAGVCFGPLRATLLAKAYKKHPSLGFRSILSIIKTAHCLLVASRSFG